MKKWICLILVLGLSLSFVACTDKAATDDIEPVTAEVEETQAAEEETEEVQTGNEGDAPVFVADDYDEVGTCGESLQWGYKKATGELIIIGSGEMDDYTAEKPAYWDGLVIRSVEIYGADTIGEYAFCDSERLATVYASDTLTDIGISAFEHCGTLRSVTLYEGVTSIGDSAFEHCGSLADLTIPDSVTNIGYYAFYDCDSLTTVTIPSGVKAVVDQSFSYCNALTSVTIPESVTTVGISAFEGCTALTDLYYGGTQQQWATTELGANSYVLNAVTIHCNG